MERIEINLETGVQTVIKVSEEEVVALQAAEAARLAAIPYQQLRAAEYPPMTDYVDGIVKGDHVQVQAYIDACLAVKTKYPKVTV